MDEKIDLISQPKNAFWKLSIPIIVFCIFDSIYSIVDLVWVSQISVQAFFAMGVSIPIVTLIFSFGDSIGQGINSMMSRFIGSGDYENAYNALIHGLILANIVWIGIVICALFTQGILFYVDKSCGFCIHIHFCQYIFRNHAGRGQFKIAYYPDSILKHFKYSAGSYFHFYL